MIGKKAMIGQIHKTCFVAEPLGLKASLPSQNIWTGGLIEEC